MAEILLNWVYIAFTTFCMGFAWMQWMKQKLHFEIKKIDTIVALGIMAATVYAQVFSLFCKVALLANVILLLLCMGICIVYGKKAGAFLKTWWKMTPFWRRLSIGILFMVWGYFTSRGIIHYDSDLYHAQSIRWIEEYGVVKGLGNLHVRFGYNSSLFALQALYSMKFMLGQSLHAVNGFMAFLLSISLLDICDSWRKKKFRLSDYARVAAIYYVCMICDEIVSPASDYTIMIVIFYIIIKWLAQLEAQQDKKTEGNVAAYALLCVAGVYAVTVKLTAGLILLLVIKPAVNLIREKQWGQIAVYITMGLVIILPWLIRNVVITGYLLYPFPALDLFGVDWKIPAAMAQTDASEIKTWGRALYDASKVNLPVTQWFGNWFETTLSLTEKLLILADISCVAIFAVTCIVNLIFRKQKQWDYLLVMATVTASYLFWQLSAPLMRYGYTHVLLLVTLTAGFFVQNSKIWKKQLTLLVYGVVLIAGLWKTVALANDAYNLCRQEYYFKQKDYGVYELAKEKIGEVTVYVPITGDRTGYDAFPAVPRLADDLRLRGKNLKEGFFME